MRPLDRLSNHQNELATNLLIHESRRPKRYDPLDLLQRSLCYVHFLEENSYRQIYYIFLLYVLEADTYVSLYRLYVFLSFRLFRYLLS